MAEGAGRGERPELVGGGLIRSMGRWSEVVALRGKREREVSDERILGSGEFGERMVEEAREGMKEMLWWRKRGWVSRHS